VERPQVDRRVVPQHRNSTRNLWPAEERSGEIKVVRTISVESIQLKRSEDNRWVPQEINHAAGSMQRDDAAVREAGALGAHYFAAANGRHAADADATFQLDNLWPTFALGRVFVE
jgi:hypothetical protein